MPLKPGTENLILGKNLSFQKRAFLKRNVFFFLKRRKTAGSATKVVWIQSCFHFSEKNVFIKKNSLILRGICLVFLCKYRMLKSHVKGKYLHYTEHGRSQLFSKLMCLKGSIEGVLNQKFRWYAHLELKWCIDVHITKLY